MKININETHKSGLQELFSPLKKCLSEYVVQGNIKSMTHHRVTLPDLA